MRARIHRGAAEIGGSCIELEARGARLVLDIGRPISAPVGTEVPLPAVPGLDGHDPSLLGIVLSHGHLDHCGLVGLVAPTVPVFVGEATQRMLAEASFFTGGHAVRASSFLRHREAFEIGPFLVTPFLNDHSAYDAYSLLVEAGGRRLFYTGDIRAHGRKAAIFEELLRRPPEGVHVLLMDGTHIRPDSDGTERGATETDVENECVDTFRTAEGMILALYSPQNIDRLVTLYRAAIRSGRDLVMDLYAATVAAATGRDTIPQADWNRVRVYLPRSQRSRVIREQAFERTEAVRSRRIYPEELAARPGELVMTFRLSMARELAATGCLAGAQGVWSMWPGYLRQRSGAALQRFLVEHRVPLKIHHASGHAFIPDLRRLANALRPARIVPIHSLGSDRFAEFFDDVERHHDGDWWEV